MSRENMNKFFSECKNNLNLQNELLSLKKESENLNGLNIINFLNKKLMPFIKSQGYDISLSDFLNYPYELSTDELSNVAGGFSRTAVAIPLTLISMLGSFSLGANVFSGNNKNDSLSTNVEQSAKANQDSLSIQDLQTLNDSVKESTNKFFDKALTKDTLSKENTVNTSVEAENNIENKSIDTQVSASKEENKSIDTQDSTLKEENEKLKEEISHLKEQISNLETENKELKTKLSSHEDNTAITPKASTSTQKNNLGTPPPPPPSFSSSQLKDLGTPPPPPPLASAFQNISAPPPITSIQEQRTNLSEEEQKQLLENIKKDNAQKEQAQIQANKMEVEKQKKDEAKEKLSTILPVFQFAQGDKSFLALPATNDNDELFKAELNLKATAQNFNVDNVINTLKQIKMAPSAINQKYADLDDLWNKANSNTLTENDKTEIGNKCDLVKGEINKVFEKQRQQNVEEQTVSSKNDIESISSKVNNIKKDSDNTAIRLEKSINNANKQLEMQQNKINEMLSTKPENVDFENYSKQVINQYNNATKKLNEIKDKITELTSQSEFSKAKFDKLQDLGNNALKLIDQLKNVQTAMEGNISAEQKSELTKLESNIKSALKADKFNNNFRSINRTNELEKQINDYEKASLRYDELSAKEGKTDNEQKEFKTLEDVMNGSLVTYKGTLYNNNGEKVNIANMKKQLAQNLSTIENYNNTLSKLSAEAQNLLNQIK